MTGEGKIKDLKEGDNGYMPCQAVILARPLRGHVLRKPAEVRSGRQ